MLSNKNGDIETLSKCENHLENRSGKERTQIVLHPTTQRLLPPHVSTPVVTVFWLFSV
jgi:hypothetical protein